MYACTSSSEFAGRLAIREHSVVCSVIIYNIYRYIYFWVFFAHWPSIFPRRGAFSEHANFERKVYIFFRIQFPWRFKAIRIHANVFRLCVCVYSVTILCYILAIKLSMNTTQYVLYVHIIFQHKDSVII